MAGARMSAAEIGLALGKSRSAIIGAASRKGIPLLASSAGRSRPNCKPRQYKPRGLYTVKHTDPVAYVPHIVITKAPVKPADIPPCLWHGCTNNTMQRGKPYCKKHHIEAGGRF